MLVVHLETVLLAEPEETIKIHTAFFADDFGSFSANLAIETASMSRKSVGCDCFLPELVVLSLFVGKELGCRYSVEEIVLVEGEHGLQGQEIKIKCK